MTLGYTSTFCLTNPVDKGVKTWWGSPVDNRPSTYKVREVKQLRIETYEGLGEFLRYEKSLYLFASSEIDTAADLKGQNPHHPGWCKTFMVWVKFVTEHAGFFCCIFNLLSQLWILWGVKVWEMKSMSLLSYL